MAGTETRWVRTIQARCETPDPAELRRLLDAARGTIRMVTIAPELPGALDAIALLS